MRKLLPVFILGFAAASLLVLGFGDSGLLAYRSLASYRDALESNLQSLTAVSEKLTAELDSLQNGAGRTEVLARDVGLYREGDQVIRLEPGPSKRAFLDVGRFVRAPRRGEPRNPLLKGLGIGLAASLSMLFLVLRRLSRVRKRNEGRGG